MQLRPWLRCLAVASGALLLVRAGAARSAPERPNIVFVLVDDLRVGALGCEGHPFVKTPNLDRLAREGALFKNAFVTTPLCSPARGSFLTGQYVRTHGVRGNGNNNALSHQLVTFPKLLHDGGYETAYVGKWHMGNDSAPRPGFDRWVSFRGQGVYQDPLLNVDGQEAKTEGYITDLLSGHAVEWVRRKHEKPFALYLAHKAVHGPFTPAERHAGLYENDPIPHPPSTGDTLEGKPALTRPIEGQQPARPGGGAGERLIRAQLRCLMSIDEGVGQLYQALQQTGQLDKTMFVFTSDNGYFWGEHGLGDKRAAYEESIRVPLLIRYPPLIKPGTKVEETVLNVDFAPTFLELGGQPVPASVQGRSLLQLLRGEKAGWRKSALFEYYAEPAYPRIPTWHAVRTDGWKYIHYDGQDAFDELYDLKADPFEMKNRIQDPGASAQLASLKAELDRLLKEAPERAP